LYSDQFRIKISLKS